MTPPIEIGATSGTEEAVGYAMLALAGASLLLARRAPAAALGAGGVLVVVAVALGSQSDTAVLTVVLVLGVVAGLCFPGRAAWVAGAWFAGVVAAMYVVTGEPSIGILMLTAPPFVAATVLRLRRRTADELAVRARELEEERELYATLAVRNERARIAAELHDIVGHSLSVMVVQAQAGQRLAERDPAAGQEAMQAIAEAARQGRDDLGRLVALLSGEIVNGADLGLIDEVVARAARSGLRVTCRFEGDHHDTAPAAAQLAFRVVQEGLTNALRHAPGTSVRVSVRGDGGTLVVRVEDDGPATADRGSVPVPTPIVGTGTGLTGLRSRVQALGGSVVAGPSGTGWRLEAVLPTV